VAEPGPVASGRVLRKVAGWEESGIPLSTASDMAAQLLDMAAEEIVAVTGDPMKTAKAAAAADAGWVVPACVVLWLQYVGCSAPANDPEVESLVEAARTCLVGRTHHAWEEAFARAILVMAEGRLDQCIMGVEEALELSPKCAMLLKIHQDLCFFVGAQQRMRDMIARSLPLLDENTTPMYGYVLGMYAFALAENEQTDLGEEMARRAIAIYPKDVWALHAMAHILEERNLCGEVVAFAKATEDDWKDSNLRCHMNFHVGVARLDKGGDASALDHYDKEVATFVGKGGSFALVDASQLLTRMTLEGVSVGARWAPVVDLWFEHVHDHRLAFNDVHISLAAAAADDSARYDMALSSMEAFLGAASDVPVQERVHQSTLDILARVGVPILKGTHAFRAGDYDAAVSHLAPVRYAWKGVGGSNVQRGVLALLLFHAAVRSKTHKNLALQLLNQADRAGVSETSKRFRLILGQQLLLEKPPKGSA